MNVVIWYTVGKTISEDHVSFALQSSGRSSGFMSGRVSGPATDRSAEAGLANAVAKSTACSISQWAHA